MSKTIGFIDYYLDEWHANAYPEKIKRASLKMGIDIQLKYAWAEEYVSPKTGVNTDEWCAKHGVEKCDTIEQLCEKVDCVLILAPSNPEKHLDYAKRVFPFGKNTYIDKTFAPDFDTASKIFALASEQGIKFFSTSALRYASELDEIQNAQSVTITGGGSNLEEYIIHQIEMAVKTINEKAISVAVCEKDGVCECDIVFDKNKSAKLKYARAFKFSIGEQNGEQKSIQSPYFDDLIESILKFYQNSTLPFDGKQTLEIIKIRDGILKSIAEKGKTVQL